MVGYGILGKGQDPWAILSPAKWQELIHKFTGIRLENQPFLKIRRNMNKKTRQDTDRTASVIALSCQGAIISSRCSRQRIALKLR